MTSLPLGSESKVNTFTTGGQDYSAIAMDADGDYVVTWSSSGQDGNSFGIYGQRYNRSGVAVGSEFRVNTFTTGVQDLSSVSMDDSGNFVVTWQSDNQDGNGTGIYAQRYSSSGTAVGSEFRVNSFTTGAQDSVSVSMNDDGNFVAVWESNEQDGDGNGIYGQRYNSSGAAVGSEFKINTSTVGDQEAPSVAMADNGNFVAVWEGNDGSSDGIFAQRYNSSGAAVGSQFQINTFTTNNQANASVAIDADGDFVVTWQSDGNPGENGYGIYAKRFKADGTAIGSEFRVNTFTTGDQGSPAVAMSDNGQFTITWDAPNKAGDSGSGIYAQRYNADGTTNGSEFRVNTFTTSDQNRPAIAMDADGDFAVVWDGNGQDGSDRGVYAQRYSLPSEIQFSNATYEVNENGTAVGTVVTLNRTHEKLAAQVKVNITGGTATAGSDFNSAGFPMTVSFAAGETSKTVTLPIVQDAISETTETITLSLTGLGDTLLGTQSTATLKILDNDSSTNEDDIIEGTSGADKLAGLEGDDKLSGNDGNDRLKGGDDDDILDGGTGDDRLLGGKDEDTLIGSNGNDLLKGGADDDILNGGQDDDRLIGGRGDDMLTGGGGADIFDRLSDKGFALIKDFENGVDQLGLSRSLKFNDLTLTQQGQSTLLRVDGSTIAELQGVRPNEITAADFI